MLKRHNVISGKLSIINYFRLKKKFNTKKRRYLLNIKNKYLLKFNRKRNIYFIILLNIYFNIFRKYILFFTLNKENNLNYLKFYFIRYIYSFYFFFKKTYIYIKLNNLLNIYFSSLDLLSNKIKRIKLKKRIRKKLRFYYDLIYNNKYKVYKLKVKMVNSNFFITLTDPYDNVIISRSTGQVSEDRKKKVKLSPYLVTRMMYLILYKLRKLKIKYLNFFVNTKINRHINNVMKALKGYRYTKILKVFFSKPIPHHLGTRKPKLRRL
jgi:ribosomal protein S11